MSKTQNILELWNISDSCIVQVVENPNLFSRSGSMVINGIRKQTDFKVSIMKVMVLKSR